MPSDTPMSQHSGFTVADLCERWRVGQDKVHGWIRRGELRAINVASNLAQRPRWIVAPEAVQEFERRRAGGPPPAKPRRKRIATVRDYYPD